MIRAALMYLDGYPAVEIEAETGCTVEELITSGALTPEMKKRHKRMAKLRVEYGRAAEEWDAVRIGLLNSGKDLGRIRIVSRRVSDGE